MDHDLGRTDLLSSNVPTFIVLMMMVIAVAAWFFAHHWKERIPRSPGMQLLSMIGRVVVGALAVWCVCQFFGRFLVLATTWSLWFSAFLASVSVEMVAILYKWERSIVSVGLGKALTRLRVAAVMVVTLILLQPVLLREVDRVVERELIVLIDDSESMHLTDERLSITEKLDLAALFEVDAVSGRHGLGDVLKSANTSFLLLKKMRDSLALPDGSGAESTDRMLKKRRDELLEVVSICLDTNAELRPIVDAVDRDGDGLNAATKNVLGEIGGVLKDALGEQLSEIRRRLNYSEQGEVEVVHAGVLNNLAKAMEHYTYIAQRLPVAMEDADRNYFASLGNTRRQAIEQAARHTRAEIARQILVTGETSESGSLLSSLGKKYKIKLVRFARDTAEVEIDSWLKAPAGIANDMHDAQGKKPFHRLTDLAGALEFAMKSVSSENLAGVLVLTDGRHNAETQVEDAARRLGVQNAPVCSVVIGSRQGPRDASVLAVEAPESIYLGDKVAVNADLKFDGLRGKRMRVALMFNGEAVEETTVAVPQEGYRHSVRFRHSPQDKGIFRYSLQIEAVSGELYDSNNHWDFEVAVTDDRTNVLIVDSYPRWEFRYLRNLFYGRDKSVHLQYVLTDPDLVEGQQARKTVPASAGREFGDAEATGLPADRSEWLKFDAIILGDVDPNYYDDDTWKHIEYCVSRRGAMLVLIAGPRYMPHAYLSSEFADLCPVIFRHSEQTQYDSPEEAYRIVATAEGRNHLVMQQSSSRSINAQIWGSIPSILWRHEVEGTKEGAEVLAYAEPVNTGDEQANGVDHALTVEQAIENLGNKKSLERKNPLIVYQRYEKGKVMMFCFDRTWRLRFRVGDTYHHRLWGQVLRWGTGENLRSGTEYVRLGSDQLSYMPHEPVNVMAKVIDEKRRPVTNDKLTVSVFKEDTLILSKQLEYREDSNGIYESLLNPFDEPGRYRMELNGKKARKLLEADDLERVETEFRIVASKNPVELAELTSDREIPQRVAVLSSGAVAGPSDARRLVEYFGEARKLFKEHSETALWHSWPLFLAFIGLITSEWILRKKGGLA